jgi:hypothetical protein
MALELPRHLPRLLPNLRPPLFRRLLQSPLYQPPIGHASYADYQGKLQELQCYQAPLKVVTDRSSDAAAVLKAKGWRVLENSGDVVTLQISCDTDIAVMNRCFLEHDIQVYRLERRQETLEDLSLRLVSTSEQDSTP